ncbi:hypothetical protein [Bacillus canaveralius]|uniref:hypothetical protein n=1 Tax=Bacillus canaveralius TaxID=1403243 RepID=UPI001159DAA7|nr:hypothetical protein [Bacillus canaveralius]
MERFRGADRAGNRPGTRHTLFCWWAGRWNSADRITARFIGGGVPWELGADVALVCRNASRRNGLSMV